MAQLNNHHLHPANGYPDSPQIFTNSVGGGMGDFFIHNHYTGGPAEPRGPAFCQIINENGSVKNRDLIILIF